MRKRTPGRKPLNRSAGLSGGNRSETPGGEPLLSVARNLS